MNEVELHYGSATDVGRVRATNQDAFLAQPPVFVVADGMGGHDDGDVASRMVVEEFALLTDAACDAERGAELVIASLRSCHGRLLERAEDMRTAGQPDWYSGTTAVVALVVEDEGVPKWLLANLGDSRIYKLSDGDLDQVSIDHSVVQEMFDAGHISAAEMATHPRRNVITRALGGPGFDQPDFFLLPLASAERIVLCSDGVSGMIDGEAIAGILRDTPDPRDAAERVVAAAVEAGGQDNATAVVVDVVGLARSGQVYDSAQQQQSLEEKLGALP
ncbi:serine/threonine-protein phosphatase [Nocardioides sp. ChNu-153]|uniref:PP2C family protein-serine/threonine phosphatase n=1 Tax=unclassified Nocardioides TaxID=2615069 RepID=UPI0024066AE3|nr:MULTISPECIES: protein phosphatase 2C domain-containing protein [unclassified Nocardioides]MDF9718131.1 protein phosphatase 2C domain-containing protein [Nocardioides sp. ChNu-99]MDN7120372.1 serine/threonine-protein phosphatase [Nocardioides sp. ChNu-153]